jgi:GAF domain-containing protein
MNDNAPSSPSLFDATKWREGFVLSTLRVALILGVALIVVNFPASTGRDLVLYMSLYALLLVVTILPAPYSIRSGALLAISFIVGVNSILVWGPWKEGSVLLIVGIVLASLLFDRRVDLAFLFTSILFITGIAALESMGIHRLAAENAPKPSPADWIGYLAGFALVGAAIAAALQRFKAETTGVILSAQSRLDSLSAEKSQIEQTIRSRAEEAERRMSQVRAAAVSGRAITGIEDIPELLETSVRYITEKFGHYHAGIFILDEQKNTAFLQAASSEIGRHLAGQAFRIESDKRNPFFAAVSQNRFIISSDLEQGIFLRDDNFPATRSRMILPLSVRGSVIGFFDIHSDRPESFTPQDAEILQPLADLTALSFDNIRLLNNTQTLLSQLEVNTSVQTQSAWSNLISRQRPIYQYTPAGVRPVIAHEKRLSDDEKDGLLIPLVLHGQRIGTIRLKRKGAGGRWSPRERALVEKIAAQISLALENSRLVDEAQKSAIRDQMIANVSARIRETLDIESVIRTAASELRRVFDLKEAEITVGAPQLDSVSRSFSAQ